MAAKTRVYTEGYAPPEQIVGKPEPRSDLFALAGTLYHLATGKAPEGFYTGREIDGQAGREQRRAGGAALVLRADPDQPGRGRQRPLPDRPARSRATWSGARSPARSTARSAGPRPRPGSRIVAGLPGRWPRPARRAQVRPADPPRQPVLRHVRRPTVTPRPLAFTETKALLRYARAPSVRPRYRPRERPGPDRRARPGRNSLRRPSMRRRRAAGRGPADLLAVSGPPGRGRGLLCRLRVHLRRGRDRPGADDHPGRPGGRSVSVD